MFFSLSHRQIHVLLATLLQPLNFTIMSVIKAECIHAGFLTLISRSSLCGVCVCVSVYCISVSSCGLWGLRPKHLGTRCGLLPPPPCQMIFTHISLAVEPADGSWQMPSKRNHNSCRWATYANMFTHEGILSKKNLPHGNSSHVCHMALVSRSFKYEITGQILSFAVGVIFMTWSKHNKLSRQSCHLHLCLVIFTDIAWHWVSVEPGKMNPLKFVAKHTHILG